MTDDSQPPSYGPPPGQGPYHGQPHPPQYGPQPGSQPGPYWQPPSGPQYGQPPPFGQQPQYGQPYFPPRIDPKAVKPRLWWLAVLWGVFVACVAAGVYVFVGGLTSLTPTTTFAPGESVTVAIDPAAKSGVYIASDTQVTYDCSISGGPGPARLAKTTGSRTLTVGNVVWEQFLVINAPAKGEYQLTCANQEQATVRYAVGRDAFSAVGGFAGGIAGLLLIPGAGLLVAIAGTVVVLLRRRSSRRRLAVGG